MNENERREEWKSNLHKIIDGRLDYSKQYDNLLNFISDLLKQKDESIKYCENIIKGLQKDIIELKQQLQEQKEKICGEIGKEIDSIKSTHRKLGDIYKDTDFSEPQ